MSMMSFIGNGSDGPDGAIPHVQDATVYHDVENFSYDRNTKTLSVRGINVGDIEAATINNKPMFNFFRAPADVVLTVPLAGGAYSVAGNGVLTSTELVSISLPYSVTPVTGLRVLLTSENSPNYNGLWEITQVGSGSAYFELMRTEDAATWETAINYFIIANNGNGSSASSSFWYVGGTVVGTLNTDNINPISTIVTVSPGVTPILIGNNGYMLCDVGGFVSEITDVKLTTVPGAGVTIVGLSLAVRTITGTDTVYNQDYTMQCDASAGSFAVMADASTLPVGFVCVLIKTDSSANTITFNGNASTFNGASTVVLSTQWQVVRLQVLNSTTWIRI